MPSSRRTAPPCAWVPPSRRRGSNGDSPCLQRPNLTSLRFFVALPALPFRYLERLEAARCAPPATLPLLNTPINPPPMPPAQPLARASPGDGGGGGGAPSTSDEGRERKSSRPSQRQRRCGHCGARATPERQLKACARCFGAHYCSRACQEKAWSQHRVRSAPPHLIDAHRIPSYPMSCGAHPRISPHAHVHAIDISCRSVSCRSVAPRLHTAPWTWPVARRASQLTPTK